MIISGRIRCALIFFLLHRGKRLCLGQSIKEATGRVPLTTATACTLCTWTNSARNITSRRRTGSRASLIGRNIIPLHGCRSICFSFTHSIPETRSHCFRFRPSGSARMRFFPVALLFGRCINQSLHLCRRESFRVCHSVKESIGAFSGPLCRFCSFSFGNFSLHLGRSKCFSVGQSIEYFGRDEAR